MKQGERNERKRLSNIKRLNSIMLSIEKLQWSCRDEVLSDRLQTAKDEIQRGVSELEAKRELSKENQ